MSLEIQNGDLSGMLGQIDLTGVSTDRPIPKAGLLHCTIKDFELKENKKKDGKNLVVTLTLKNETDNDAGDRKLQPGFPLYDIISLVKLDNYNPLERLAQLQLAALGVKKAGFDVNELKGRDVWIRGKKESSDDFGDQFRIQRYVEVTDKALAAATQAPKLNAL